ncbi:MAG: hypothetical protein IIB19_05375 [Chloroflexi bacterium]|nr:hypothetical protein [Chloroflexota bacterium]
MGTRKKVTLPDRKTVVEPPAPRHCADCNWFDYQTPRQGICRLRPPFIQVHPTDRCSFFQLADVRPTLGA